MITGQIFNSEGVLVADILPRPDGVRIRAYDDGLVVAVLDFTELELKHINTFAYLPC